MKIKQTSNQTGFTIIELLMATIVFSVVLLIVTTGIIKIGQSYYRGLIQNKTQESTRNISEDITRTIQLASGQKIPGATPNIFCIGTVRYTSYLNEKVGDDPAIGGLKAEKVPPGVCGAPADPNPRQLLSKNMRLLRFKVEPSPPSQLQTWQIDVKVAYGDNDLLNHYDNGDDIADRPSQTADCKSGVTGGSFCATAQLNNTVKKRLRVN